MSATVESRPSPISPICVSPNGRHFVDPGGRPVFWLSDTQWELFRLFTPDTALQILKDRQRKGFNAILIMLLGVEMARPDVGIPAGYANLQGEQPWIGGDPDHPNEAYFRHIDAMVRLGEQTGQTFVVGVYHQWHVETITLPKARRWARWVARRYRDVPNLIWCMYPRATDDYIPVCRELAAGLQEGDNGAHLISIHPDPSVASSSFMHDEPWLAFNMIQTCMQFDQIWETVTADFARIPTRPVVMAEGAYEGIEFGRLQTPHDIRKQAYWTQLAGGYHGYGHNDSWAAPLAWREWLDSPGSRHLKAFREIITSLDRWWEMGPAPAVLASGTGSGFQLNAAALSPGGRWVLVYLSEPSTVTARLDALSGAPTAQAHWISTTTGDRTPAGIFPAVGTQAFTAPSAWEDALLLIETP